MLVLTRKPGETVVVGPNAELTVTLISIKGREVKIGFEADPNIPIHREEIYNRIRKENKSKGDEYGNQCE